MNKNLIEVIRCKDCAYGERVFDIGMNETNLVLCHEHPYAYEHDECWYCANGERSEE